MSLITRKKRMRMRMKLSVRLKNVMNSMLLIKSNVVVPIRMWKGESSVLGWNGSLMNYRKILIQVTTYMRCTRCLLIRRTWHSSLWSECTNNWLVVTVTYLKINWPCEHLQTPPSPHSEWRFRYLQDWENSHGSSIRIAGRVFVSLLD